MSDIIAFKGVSDGVYLELKSNEKEKIMKDIKKVMRKSQDFFKGTKFLGFLGKELSIKDALDISYMLKYKYGFDISVEEILGSLEETVKILEGNNKNREIIEEKKENNEIDKGKTHFIYGTLRSGQEVKYDGNIVVIGDVNPGAFLKADGNIVVLGSLKGVAYAGLNGNKKAIVAANNLLPTQLKIADIIGRSPDEYEAEYRIAEVARILDEKVVIEPYLPNK